MTSGTGNSAIACVKHFPIDTIKIDRSFVSGVTSSASDAAIAGATIAMARQLGLNVVAEGVEQGAQLEFSVVTAAKTTRGISSRNQSQPPHSANSLQNGDFPNRANDGSLCFRLWKARRDESRYPGYDPCRRGPNPNDLRVAQACAVLSDSGATVLKP